MSKAKAVFAAMVGRCAHCRPPFEPTVATVVVKYNGNNWRVCDFHADACMKWTGYSVVFDAK